jgi:hypothetical protein
MASSAKAESAEEGRGVFGAAGDAALCVWFLLAGVAFFGPYLGLPLPDLGALYAVFLLLAAAGLALRLLKGRGEGSTAAKGEGE